MLIRLADPTMPRWLVGEAREPGWLRASLPTARFPHEDGEEDDEGGDGAEDEEEPEEEEESDEDDKDQQISDLKKALKKANRDAARNRRRAQASGEEEDEASAEKSDERVAKLEKEIWTRDAAEELRERGVTGSKQQLARYVKMLDSIDPDDLEDSIDKLEDDMPDLFRKKPAEDTTRRRRPATARRRAEDKPDGETKPVLSASTKAMFKHLGIRAPRN